MSNRIQSLQATMKLKPQMLYHALDFISIVYLLLKQ